MGQIRGYVGRMYNGHDRVKQVQSLSELAADIVGALPEEVDSDDISLPELGVYLPVEWPDWVMDHDLVLLVAMVKNGLEVG